MTVRTVSLTARQLLRCHATERSSSACFCVGVQRLLWLGPFAHQCALVSFDSTTGAAYVILEGAFFRKVRCKLYVLR